MNLLSLNIFLTLLDELFLMIVVSDDGVESGILLIEFGHIPLESIKVFMKSLCNGFNLLRVFMIDV